MKRDCPDAKPKTCRLCGSDKHLVKECDFSKDQISSTVAQVEEIPVMGFKCYGDKL